MLRAMTLQLQQFRKNLQLSSNFLNDEKQTKAQMALLGQEIKNVQLELHEHRVKAVEGNPQTVGPNQKKGKTQHDFTTTGAQKGHTLNWCRKRIREQKLERIENERTAEKSHVYSRLQRKTRTSPWITTMG